MLAGNERATPPVKIACTERERLLAELRTALSALSAADRQSDAARAVRQNCAEVWNDLRRHQAEHKCGR